MSGVDETHEWAVERLRGLLAKRGVELLSPREHRDRWLQAILDFTHGFRIGRPPREPTPEFRGAALDLAAGLLLEMPRLESDAWRGWADPRLKPVFDVLKLADLPEAPPRAGLAECWRDLRELEPFPVVQPKPGDAPQHVGDFLAESSAWLGRLLQAAAEVVTGPAAPVREGGSVPMPPELLRARLLEEVEAHIERVGPRVLPLAHHLFSTSFVGQRWGAMLHRARGEQERLDQGRPLRVRSKLRYHLAVWVLGETDLTVDEAGLFLWLIDPTGLKNRPQPRGASGTQTGLEKEVSTSRAYWTRGAGLRGLEPMAHIGQIEFELRDLLLPCVQTVEPRRGQA